MSLKKIKSELNKLDKDKIVDLIADLYKKNKSVKEYLDFFVKPDEKALSLKYRNKIGDLFYVRGNFDLSIKLKQAKQLIRDFALLETSPIFLADLKLFFVECGVKFANIYGDDNKSFESSIINMYEEALNLMWKNDLLEHFMDRADNVLFDAYDSCSFCYVLHEINSNYLADYHNYEEVNENAEIKEEAKIIPL